MLNDAERRRLEEIETCLRTDDPTFVRRFERWRPRRWRHHLFWSLALGATLAGTLVALLLHSVATVVAGLVVSAGTVGLWVSRRSF